MRASQILRQCASTLSLCAALLLPGLFPSTAQALVYAGHTGEQVDFILESELSNLATHWLKSRGSAIRVLMVDEAEGILVVGCSGEPAALTKIRIGSPDEPMRVVGELELKVTDGRIVAGVIDPISKQVLIATTGKKSELLVFDLGSVDAPLARMGALPWPSGSNPLDNAVIDAARGCAYFRARDEIIRVAMPETTDALPQFGSRNELGFPHQIHLDVERGYGCFFREASSGSFTPNLVLSRFSLGDPLSPIELDATVPIEIVVQPFNLPLSPQFLASVYDAENGLLFLFSNLIDGQWLQAFQTGVPDVAPVEVARLKLPVALTSSVKPLLDGQSSSLHIPVDAGIAVVAIQDGGETLSFEGVAPLPSGDGYRYAGAIADAWENQLVVVQQADATTGPRVDKAEDLLSIGTIAHHGIMLPPPSMSPKYLLHLPDSGAVLVGMDTKPSQLVVVPADRFGLYEEPTSRLLLTLSDQSSHCAVYDEAWGGVLLGIGDDFGAILPVHIDSADGTMTCGNPLMLEAGEEAPRCAVIDPATGIAYFGVGEAPGRIVAVRADPQDGALTRLGTLALEHGEDRPLAATLDASNAYAYFATGGQDARLMKIALIKEDLADFQRVGSANLDRPGIPKRVVFDDTNHELYVLSADGNRQYIHTLDADINAAPPTRSRTISAPSDIFDMVLRPDIRKAFFASTTNRVVDVPVPLRFYLWGTYWHGPAYGPPYALVTKDPASDALYFAMDRNPIGIDRMDVRHPRQVLASRINLPEEAAVRSVRARTRASGGNLRLGIYDDARAPLSVLLNAAANQLSAAQLQYHWPRNLLWQSPVLENSAEPGWFEVDVAPESGQPLRLPAGEYWLAWHSTADYTVMGALGSSNHWPTWDLVRVSWTSHDNALPPLWLDELPGLAKREKYRVWDMALGYDPAPRVEAITPLVTSPTGADPVRFELRFNTGVQGLESGDDLVIVHTGTTHSTVSIEGEGASRIVSLGGLSGRGSFTLSVRTDTGVRNSSDVPLQSTMTSQPVVFSHGYWDGGAAGWHAADTNRDGRIALTEILRIIQFYNAGGLHCADPLMPVDDGFEPGDKPESRACAPHSSDYAPQDWRITLTELLRLAQFYNAGAYHPCQTGEDNYCPGPAN